MTRRHKWIQLFGAGCANCETMLENVRTAVAEAEPECTLEHVTSIQKMLSAGITGTPALVVDGHTVAVGRVLDVATIKALLQ